jgi:hypothetical protein
MYAANSATNSERPARHSDWCQNSGPATGPSKRDIRTFLIDLRMRPATEREFLCRLLKRAAQQASTTDSAVHLAESPHPK